ncbi:hypothetical protein RSOLAG22IIIB_11443 [Rhizoctonia solani]|uniref:Uncharacterized protein n=1 Tax=Rhizoctonia solani TaxID=456999 RepID=A0A0K6G7W5_9AGAM|nr:hypothetical protein RSOLAG22IIIB_11443 [Rhizoctonia solani]
MSAQRPKGNSSALSEPIYDSTLFASLKVHSDGKQAIKRTRPPLGDTVYKQKRHLRRETERKKEHDSKRLVLNCIAAAIANKIILPFRMSKFLKKKNAGEIPVSELHPPYDGLVNHKTKLQASGTPKLIVDLDDIVVFWYFPHFIGTGTQDLVLSHLAELVKVYPPVPDSESGDRRSDVQRIPETTREGQRVTRSMAQQAAPILTEEVIPFPSGSLTDGEEEPTDDESENAPVAEVLDRYEDADKPIKWRASGKEAKICHELLAEKSGPQFAALCPTVLPPSAYYLSPGWFPTGMENKKPMNASLHFRRGLQPVCAQQMINFLESKRLYDRQVTYLTNIIHQPLAESMGKVRASMKAIKGPTGDILEHGWTSAFPCLGLGMNRASGIHRDSKGLSAGMDVIGVFGTFTSGGQLWLPDLNLEVEWTPGCLAAFDGYDLRHMVRRWDGGCRVALISFCRSSTWRGLKLSTSIPRPTLSQVQGQLDAAKEGRSKLVGSLVAQRTKRKHSDIAQ